MMDGVSAVKASTYVHKHPQVHPLNVNAFSTKLQTRALTFAACSASFFVISADGPRDTFTRKVPEGPPQKRSPALGGNKRRANREFGKSERQNSTKAGQDSQATECRPFWVTHGQANIGFVQQAGKRYTAKDADERDIGLFDSLKPAADAVGARYDKNSCAKLLDQGVS
jgi:hypothetical protein